MAFILLADGFLALAMMPLTQLAETLPLPALNAFTAKDAFTKRDEIKRVIAAELMRHPTAYWLARLRSADVWCAEVLDWPRLLESEAFARLDMLQTVERRARMYGRRAGCCGSLG